MKKKKEAERERETGKWIKLGFLHIHLTNRWLYTFITIGILAIIGGGVYAWANPTTGVGHDLSEIEPCPEGQILQTSAGAWTCVDIPSGAVETDPTVLASVKDGISWSEIGGIPADIADGDDLGNHIATQNLNLNNNKIINLATPTSNTDAATKAYVDAQGAGTYTRAFMQRSTTSCGSGWTRVYYGGNCYTDLKDSEILCCEPDSEICYARQGTNIYSAVTSGNINPSGFCDSGRDWALCCK